ncbi:HAD hydrolase-like protein [Erwinia psidii]|uniref:HAD family hydrolase n=1 Tax=Erwinia psidii TaxID=69224 RepID=A0A3N6SBP2_9GAMM|nr:HAD hydrolase-like protein [Erwinia psidii]MCX8956067.1 HAD family hydrolase [Erwinia psidii]MCX8963713.1 HAD family hydrolase [Erwinia psidii]RQM38770.1 HAD family hydrolase [Erwinia psidii]
MTIKLVIFDFDGTLADSWPVFTDSLNGLAARHGFRQVNPEGLDALRSKSATEVLRELQLPLWKVPAVLSDFRKIMRQRISEIEPFPNMAAVLHALLQQPVELAIATSNSFENVEAVLGRDLVRHFSTVECGSSLFGKAHRIRRILKKTHVDRTQAIYIGDEIRDAEAAGRLGMSFGAVAWGYTEAEVLRRTNPYSLFQTPADMLNLNRL